MDDAERKKMIAELENKIPGMKNPVIKMSLDKAIKQFMQMEKTIGKGQCCKMIEMQKISQDQKDYIFLRMGWL